MTSAKGLWADERRVAASVTLLDLASILFEWNIPPELSSSLLFNVSFSRAAPAAVVAGRSCVERRDH
jgi:hypothetical protein